jgi:protocadherin Fat 4
LALFSDNEPKFEKSVYELSVLEEELGPKYIATLLATDRDSGKNGKVRYQWSRESESSLGTIFGIDGETGEVYAKKKLDREEIPHYSLTVEAWDLGTPSRTGSATINVAVGDKNDNPSRFTRLFNVNVTENVPIGTFVIQVTSVDKDIGDNANCSYSFTENPGNKFLIDRVSGNLTVSGVLDRETQDEYLLRVAAVDGSWRAETLVTIAIQDLNGK